MIKARGFCLLSLFYKMSEHSSDVSDEGSKMEVDRKTRRTAPINILTGIFLKTVLFLNTCQPKLLIVGIFKDKGDSLGVLFKSKKNQVYWSFDVFNQMAVQFKSVSESFDNKSRFKTTLPSGEGINMKNSFGSQYVLINDNEQTVALTKDEWAQFNLNLPIVNANCIDLFMAEDSIKEFIKSRFCGEDFTDSCNKLRWSFENRLCEEIYLYKSHMNKN